MKPILRESEDNDALLALGRASVQVVHDLKNQLNGLKLYATFLRKRLEKGDHPSDELETINKLIAGLDRSAADLSIIVEYGQPLALQRQSDTDLQKILSEVAQGLKSGPQLTGSLTNAIVLETEPGSLLGAFDSRLLINALKSISLCAMRMVNDKRNEGYLKIRLTGAGAGNQREGVIEWAIFDSRDHDPFHSFAGSNELRLSLAARVIEAHGGSARQHNGDLCVRLPLTS